MSDNNNLPVENSELLKKFQESQKQAALIERKKMAIEAEANQALNNMKKLEEEAKNTEAGSIENIPEFLRKNVPINEQNMQEFISSVEEAAKILADNGHHIENN